MSIQDKIREACKDNDSALVVCCWEVGMLRKEPLIVKAFLPPADETEEGYERRKQETRNYADAMQAAFNAKRGPYNAEEAALLVILSRSLWRGSWTTSWLMRKDRGYKQ